MSIDMTGLARLGSVGLQKVLTEIPKGQAKEGIQFAFKIKKAGWQESKYGYRYSLDVVVRTLDMQAVLGAVLWKVYPSMLPADIIEAIDCDLYDDTWWLVRTEINEKSKADPPRTLLHLIDTQQGLDASGPPKPRAGGEAELHSSSAASAPPAAPCPHPVSDKYIEHATMSAPLPPETDLCPHTKTFVISEEVAAFSPHLEAGFYCNDCRERVG